MGSRAHARPRADTAFAIVALFAGSARRAHWAAAVDGRLIAVFDVVEALISGREGNDSAKEDQEGDDPACGGHRR